MRPACSHGAPGLPIRCEGQRPVAAGMGVSTNAAPCEEADRDHMGEPHKKMLKMKVAPKMLLKIKGVKRQNLSWPI